ncbi:aspartic peptidase domain-containing protein [Microdochium bolleyi]|uniref:Aspartic peptidase domain-containing protein n=1 Tax=Microdochium bolleyi TaxID=196109 RepID=A0A136J3T7_9PEZI|nr:aspartic peptidase domain-containing protein [Microdochium bolleyi]
MLASSRLLWFASCSAAFSLETVLHAAKRVDRDVDFHERATDGTIVQDINFSARHGAFLVSVTAGTPPQRLRLKLSTTWGFTVITNAASEECVGSTAFDGCSEGSFDALASNTFVNDTSSSSWGNYTTIGTDDNSAETLIYKFVEDSFGFGDLALRNFSMGLTDVTSRGIGYLGLSLPEPAALANYTAANTSASNPHTLLDSHLSHWMVQNGSVVTPAYSIWPGDGDKYGGQLVLGGIDKTKYHGTLISIEAYNRAFVGETIHLALTGVAANSSTGTDILTADLPAAFGLDYGSSISYFPHNIATEIWKIAGAVYLRDKRIPVVPCGAANADAKLDLTLGGRGGAVVYARMAALIVPQSVMDLKQQNGGGEPLCVFQIRNHTDPAWFSIGNCLLQSTYLVADLHNRKVAMGQAIVNPEVASTSVIVPFAGRRAGIPSATPAPNPVPAGSLFFLIEEAWTRTSRSQIPTSTPNPSTTYAAQAGFTDPALWTANSTSPGNGGSLGKSAQIGIGVGAGVAGVILVAVVVLLFRRRRQTKQHQAVAGATPSTVAASPYTDGKSTMMQSHGTPSELCGQQLQSELPTWYNNQELPASPTGTGHWTSGSSQLPRELGESGQHHTTHQQPQQPPAELDSSQYRILRS